MKTIQFVVTLLLQFTVLGVGGIVQAEIIGPYSVDANTLHLWHIEDTDVPVLDASGVATPIDLTSLGTAAGGSLGAASYSPAFGKAYTGVGVANTGLFAKTPTNSTADNTSTASLRNATTGAFTYELIFRADFDPTVTPAIIQLISNDNDSGERDFQFTMVHSGTGNNFNLEFIEISPSTLAFPSSNFPVVQGHWYHAAVTYDGNENTADNLKLYWTDMTTNAANGRATLVGTANMPSDLTATESDFAIAAEARNGGGGNTGQIVGLVDEVRISDIARAANQFIFIPEPAGAGLCMLGIAWMWAWIGRIR